MHLSNSRKMSHGGGGAAAAGAAEEVGTMYENPTRRPAQPYELDYPELVRRSIALPYKYPTTDNKLSLNGGDGHGVRAKAIAK
jgi:hypothetical protein